VTPVQGRRRCPFLVSSNWFVDDTTGCGQSWREPRHFTRRGVPRGVTGVSSGPSHAHPMLFIGMGATIASFYRTIRTRASLLILSGRVSQWETLVRWRMPRVAIANTLGAQCHERLWLRSPGGARARPSFSPTLPAVLRPVLDASRC